MLKRYVTDEIEFQLEIGEDGYLKKVEVKVLDQDVFLPMDLENKQKVSRFVQVVAGQIQSVMSAKDWAKTPVRAEQVRSNQCPKCGSELKYEEACCGSKIGVLRCSNKQCPFRDAIVGRPPWAK